MHIAFVSYEFPPDTAYGGIGTYVLQIATLFSQRGIDTTVLCSSPFGAGKEQVSPTLTVHKIKCNSREEFILLSPQALVNIHEKKKLDIIEVPEYGSEGLFIKDLLPSVPLVVKLHTPGFLIKSLNDHYYNQTAFRKFLLLFKKKYNYKNDTEYVSVLKADFIISPSLSLREIVSKSWGIDIAGIVHAPNPYTASENFLRIPINPSGKTVLYFGRLECRKGVYELAKIIPAAVAIDPEVKFILLGKDSRGPYREGSMKKVVQKMCRGFEKNIEFIDKVPLDKVPGILQKASLCIFPSLWENFPGVCLEAMSAGKAIIASQEGGMADMLGNNNGGILVDPFNTAAVAKSLVKLINDKAGMGEMGEINRKKVVEYYGNSLVDELVTMYKNFISNYANRSQ